MRLQLCRMSWCIAAMLPVAAMAADYGNERFPVGQTEATFSEDAAYCTDPSRRFAWAGLRDCLFCRPWATSSHHGSPGGRTFPRPQPRFFPAPTRPVFAPREEMPPAAYEQPMRAPSPSPRPSFPPNPPSQPQLAPPPMLPPDASRLESQPQLAPPPLLPPDAARSESRPAAPPADSRPGAAPGTSGGAGNSEKIPAPAPGILPDQDANPLAAPPSPKIFEARSTRRWSGLVQP
ncbi:hypothetical protein Pla8534_37320 [Lignipirellula cremea]|uniref:Filamentous hemagglutinin n=1 Tax=Lignipirellula cremea TaxID=2528010 RepID=A0A518DVR3_9BACT|nr:hypothetical protein Pla8534_37320 [Lignipirellula cremea]